MTGVSLPVVAEESGGEGDSQRNTIVKAEKMDNG